MSDSHDFDGERISSRYAVYEPIASGGMATVHLGRLLGAVGFSRIVAIKRLHPQYSQDPDFVSMFLDEARLVARIKHPNVVPTLDVVAAKGELSLVMEYVQGECLSRLLRTARKRKSPVPLGVVAAIMSGVLHGLHAAHEAVNERGEPLGIVHRDVSPQNVLVGVDGVARVLDFGIAMAAGRIQETRDGSLKGKLAYMAPEQLRGVPASRRTDVYAAGIVLWELLSGERFHEAETDVTLIVKVMEGRRVPPSQQAWARAEARKHVSTEALAQLDAIALRALAIDAEERFATAREMALALEAAVPLAPSSEIGAWVESLAATDLAKRGQLVRDVEAGHAVPTPLDPVSRSSRSTPAAAQVPPSTPPPTSLTAPSVVRTSDDVATRVDVGSVAPEPFTVTNMSVQGDPQATPRRRRASLVLGALALAGVVGALVVTRSGASPVPPAAAATGAVTVTASQLAATVATATPEVAADAGQAAPAPVAAAVAAAPAKPARPAATTAPAAKKRPKGDADLRTER